MADRFFERRGAIAVLIARLLPVIRTFIALPAGIARMPRLKFHVYTFIGSWPWCFALAYIGMRLGEQWEKDPRLKTWFHRLDAVILAVIILAVLYFVWSHVQHRVGKEAVEEADSRISHEALISPVRFMPGQMCSCSAQAPVLLVEMLSRIAHYPPGACGPSLFSDSSLKMRRSALVAIVRQMCDKVCVRIS